MLKLYFETFPIFGKNLKSPTIKFNSTASTTFKLAVKKVLNNYVLNEESLVNCISLHFLFTDLLVQ